MKLITFVLLFTSLAFGQQSVTKNAVTAPAAATPPPERFPIAGEYMTLFNGLIQNMQAVQKQVQAAEEKLRTDICKEKGIPMADCDVNWQQGSVGRKAVEAKPAAAPPTEKK